MAKTSWMMRNEKRKKLSAKWNDERKRLKAIIRDPQAGPVDKEQAMRKLQKMPRNASPTRVVNRCMLTGRSRAYVRRFGLSRIAFREMALSGMIPGVRKASW
ncbi:MAG: 30S ribosomal protein S14 [Gemmatimonadales bacterium]|nr:30S ribosomal protein S14 [Gemmatimonadales bacterium]